MNQGVMMSEEIMRQPGANIVEDFADEGFYIQNMMPGPLFINDKRSNLVNAAGMAAGLKVLLEGHEVADLSGEDPAMLRRSPALRQAIRDGFVIVLSYQEYLGALAEFERNKRKEERERRKKIIEIDGALVEAEDINLASGDSRGSASIDPSQQINDPRTYARVAAQARQAGVNGYDFEKMVENGEIQGGGSGKFGRSIPVNQVAPEQMAPPPPQYRNAAPSQIEMTESHPVVSRATAGGYTEQLRTRPGNFNTTGRMPGYEGDYAEPVRVQQQRVIRGGGASEETIVEDCDLAMDDSSWEAMENSRNGAVNPAMGGARPISRAQ